jgi:outer membrane receptor for ferrienterochelin and colicin
LQRSDGQGDKEKLELQNNYLGLDDHILTLGLESELDTLRNVQFSNFSGFTIQGSTKADARTNAIYVQDQFSLNEHVFGTLGVRFDEHDALGSKVTYRFAPVLALPDHGLRLKGRWVRGFARPHCSSFSVTPAAAMGGSSRATRTCVRKKAPAGRSGLRKV